MGGKLIGQKWGAGDSNSNATEKRPCSDASTRKTRPLAAISVFKLLSQQAAMSIDHKAVGLNVNSLAMKHHRRELDGHTENDTLASAAASFLDGTSNFV